MLCYCITKYTSAENSRQYVGCLYCWARCMLCVATVWSLSEDKHNQHLSMGHRDFTNDVNNRQLPARNLYFILSGTQLGILLALKVYGVSSVDNSILNDYILDCFYHQGNTLSTGVPRLVYDNKHCRCSSFSVNLATR